MANLYLQFVWAQILIESGLVPGLKDNAVAIALTDNKRIINE